MFVYTHIIYTYIYTTHKYIHTYIHIHKEHILLTYFLQRERKIESESESDRERAMPQIYGATFLSQEGAGVGRKKASRVGEAGAGDRLRE